jgi:hypothetical protein
MIKAAGIYLQNSNLEYSVIRLLSIVRRSIFIPADYHFYLKYLYTYGSRNSNVERTNIFFCYSCLRQYVTSWKVSGWISNGVIEFFFQFI